MKVKCKAKIKTDVYEGAGTQRVLNKNITRGDKLATTTAAEQHGRVAGSSSIYRNELLATSVTNSAEVSVGVTNKKGVRLLVRVRLGGKGLKLGIELQWRPPTQQLVVFSHHPRR